MVREFLAPTLVFSVFSSFLCVLCVKALLYPTQILNTEDAEKRGEHREIWAPAEIPAAARAAQEMRKIPQVW